MRSVFRLLSTFCHSTECPDHDASFIAAGPTVLIAVVALASVGCLKAIVGLLFLFPAGLFIGHLNSLGIDEDWLNNLGSCSSEVDVCFVPKADINPHRLECLLIANSGHWVLH